MGIAVTIVFLVLLAVVFIGVPYYHAYARRKELQRRKGRSAECSGLERAD